MNEHIFKHRLTSEAEVRALVGYPSEVVKNKMIQRLDQHCRNFISQSPMLFLATADNSGACDVSPRGDETGFVHIIDEQHLVIPERPGNRRMDSIRNIFDNPNIGLIFIIPGLEETLRVNGKACVIQDDELLEKMMMKGKKPLLGIGVEVEECYIHCAKAFKRSALWQPANWPSKETLPHIPKVIADHANMKGLTSEDVAKSLKETYEKRLY